MNERLTAKQARELADKADNTTKIKTNANYKECIKRIKAAVKKGEHSCDIDDVYLDDDTIAVLIQDGFKIGKLYVDEMPYGTKTQREISF